MKRLMLTIFALGMSACGLDPTQDQPDQRDPGDGVATAEIGDPAGTSGDAIADSVSPANAACGTGATNRQNLLVADASSPNAANQRSGSSTSCTSLGALQPTDDAVYFCFTNGNDGFRWTYLRNARTGVLGWVRGDLLKNGGSNIICCDGTCRPGCPC